MSSLTSSEQSRGTPFGFSEDSGGASVLTDAWPADPEGAVLTPGGGRGAGVRSGAGGGEGGTDAGALDSFPIQSCTRKAQLIAKQRSTATDCLARLAPPGCRSCGRAGPWSLHTRCVSRGAGYLDRDRNLLTTKSRKVDEPKNGGRWGEVKGKQASKQVSTSLHPLFPNRLVTGVLGYACLGTRCVSTN